MNYKQFFKDPRCKVGARCFASYGTLVLQYEILFVRDDGVYAQEIRDSDLFAPDFLKLPNYIEYFFNEVDALQYSVEYLQGLLAKHEARLKILGGVNSAPGNGL